MICTTSTVSGEPGGTVGARHPRIALAITFCKIPCFRLAASNKMEAVKLEPGILASKDTTNTTAILAAKDLLIVIRSDGKTIFRFGRKTTCDCNQRVEGAIQLREGPSHDRDRSSSDKTVYGLFKRSRDPSNWSRVAHLLGYLSVDSTCLGHVLGSD